VKKSENKKIEKEKCFYCGFKLPVNDMINQKGKFICFICAKNGIDKT
jgi:formylmethanofuran dehydrogenase subunit E